MTPQFGHFFCVYAQATGGTVHSSTIASSTAVTAIIRFIIVIIPFMDFSRAYALTAPESVSAFVIFSSGSGY